MSSCHLVLCSFVALTFRAPMPNAQNRELSPMDIPREDITPVTMWTQTVFHVRWLQEHVGLYLDQWPRYPPRQFPYSGLRVIANAGCLNLSLAAIKKQDGIDPHDFLEFVHDIDTVSYTHLTLPTKRIV